MKILVLEDDIGRIEQFKSRFRESGVEGTFTQEASDCIEQLKTKKFDMIFLDHDLGGRVFVSQVDKNTGSEVARFWSDSTNKNKDTQVIIHSFNPAGVLYMRNKIHKSLYIPGLWDKGTWEKTFRKT